MQGYYSLLQSPLFTCNLLKGVILLVVNKTLRHVISIIVASSAAIATAQAQDDKWEVAVYGTNLFDTEYLTYINNIGFFKLDIFGERQTFGASVRYRFQ